MYMNLVIDDIKHTLHKNVTSIHSQSDNSKLCHHYSFHRRTFSSLIFEYGNIYSLTNTTVWYHREYIKMFFKTYTHMWIFHNCIVLYYSIDGVISKRNLAKVTVNYGIKVEFYWIFKLIVNKNVYFNPFLSTHLKFFWYEVFSLRHI